MLNVNCLTIKNSNLETFSRLHWPDMDWGLHASLKSSDTLHVRGFRIFFFSFKARNNIYNPNHCLWSDLTWIHYTVVLNKSVRSIDPSSPNIGNKEPSTSPVPVAAIETIYYLKDVNNWSRNIDKMNNVKNYCYFIIEQWIQVAYKIFSNSSI